ncbi:hypothetical protein PACTADRAFT_52118 [Pachysolen tannophilus NRRL Y-2460]|uniref:thioredoxin-dependent peroxiredoxin n=1 Tax=Pachysolen tannophilus NRRL Y-2460 TaxID=669874 RepID=A0A1E4TP70_PACTA|nr:hypothetical protein PACTADRAFT_52118 [Pachysolen tannophilus NRRL Y-2460]
MVRRSIRVAAKKEAGNGEKLKQQVVDVDTPESSIDAPVTKKSKEEPQISKDVKDVKDEEDEEDSDEVSNKKLEIGDEIPDLTFKDQDENDINLKELSKENRILVIFAYPRASTPGCTRQACGFAKNYPDLSSKATFIGLSADSPKAQKNFEVKQKLPFKLLSDPKRDLIGKLGAKKHPTGIIRSHWIFVDGILKISKVGISPEASVTGAKQDVEKLSDELKI